MPAGTKVFLFSQTTNLVLTKVGKQTQTCPADVDISIQDEEGVRLKEMCGDNTEITVTGGEGLERCDREDIGGEFVGVDGGRRKKDGEKGLNGFG